MSSQRCRTTAGQSTRDQILDAARELMEVQGFHATGMAAIIQASGAPRGSLYYYFPDGKEGLAVEAINRAGEANAERIAANLRLEGCLASAFCHLTEQIAAAVEGSDFRTGGPLAAVAMETATTSPRLNQACRQAYARLTGAFAARLEAAGHAPERAAELAEFITAAIEGGIILSRTAHSGDPLRRVGRQIGALLKEEG